MALPGALPTTPIRATASAPAWPGSKVSITVPTGTYDLDGSHAAADGGALDINQQISVRASTLASNKAGGKFDKGMGAATAIDGGATLIVSGRTIAGSTTQPAGRARSAISGHPGTVIRHAVCQPETAHRRWVQPGHRNDPARHRRHAQLPGGTPNCTVPLSETAGFNLSTDSSCGLSKTGLTGVNPMLKPLVNNGGPAMTQALPRFSPAVNAGGLPASSPCPAADQRGESRPWGPASDIGAYELQDRR